MSNPSNTKKLRLRLVDADCSSCIASIRKELQEEKGAMDVKTNPVTDTILVYYASDILTEEKIESSTGKLGYKAVKLNQVSLW